MLLTGNTLSKMNDWQTLVSFDPILPYEAIFTIHMPFLQLLRSDLLSGKQCLRPNLKDRYNKMAIN